MTHEVTHGSDPRGEVPNALVAGRVLSERLWAKKRPSSRRKKEKEEDEQEERRRRRRKKKKKKEEEVHW